MHSSSWDRAVKSVCRHRTGFTASQIPNTGPGTRDARTQGTREQEEAAIWVPAMISEQREDKAPWREAALGDIAGQGTS